MTIRKCACAVAVVFFVGASLCNSAQVTKGELNQVGQEIWPFHKGVAGIVFNQQGHFNNSDTNSKEDRAPSRLFAAVPQAALNDNSSAFPLLLALFDNYFRDVRQPETSNREEEDEISRFLDFVSSSSAMKVVFRFLQSKNLTNSTNMESFRHELETIWFGNYPRGYKTDSSSGFEHVFVGEIRSSKVIGGHNWYRFYLAEQNGQMDYFGYYKTDLVGNGSNVLTLKYKWDAFLKPKGSLFIGATPEFEMAVYTLCFYTRPNQTCSLKFFPGGRAVPILTHKIVGKDGKIYVGTAYPV